MESHTRDDAERTRLRTLIATIDRQMGNDATALTEYRLRPLWAELVQRLALGPEPEVRECPRCKKTGMRAATRCGYCWSELPLAS